MHFLSKQAFWCSSGSTVQSHEDRFDATDVLHTLVLMPIITIQITLHTSLHLHTHTLSLFSSSSNSSWFSSSCVGCSRNWCGDEEVCALQDLQSKYSCKHGGFVYVECWMLFLTLLIIVNCNVLVLLILRTMVGTEFIVGEFNTYHGAVLYDWYESSLIGVCIWHEIVTVVLLTVCITVQLAYASVLSLTRNCHNMRVTDQWRSIER